jgi:uncharacterized protein (DUF1330 family)
MLDEHDNRWVLDVLMDRVEQASGLGPRAVHVLEARNQHFVELVGSSVDTAGHDDHARTLRSSADACPGGDMAVTLLVQLWAFPGREQLLVEYEDQVLPRLAPHGARILQRVRAVDANDGPLEAHVLEFPSERALDAYMADPERVALADLRERAIARTELVRVEVVA